MKTKEEVYSFPCPCEKQTPLEKRMEVKVISKKRQGKEPVLIDVFCHGCGAYVKAPLDGDFGTEQHLRE